MQNYKTIDKYSLGSRHYLKLSSVDDLSEPHFVVAEYKESGQINMGTYLCDLMECWHFVGVAAEYETTNFFCSMIPDLAEDFPPIDLAKCVSYQANRHYVASEKEREETKRKRLSSVTLHPKLARAKIAGD